MSQKFEDMTEVITQFNENRRIEKDTIHIQKSQKDYTYVKTNCLAAIGWVGLEFDYVDQIKNLIEEVTQDYNKRVIYYLESALSRLSQLKFCSLPIRGELEECIASVHEQNRSLKEYMSQLADYVRLVNETEDSIVEQFSKIGCDYVNGVPIPIYEVDPTKDVIVINGTTFSIEVDASDIKQGNNSVHTISGFIEDYWNKDNGYFEGFWWQDAQKLKEAIAVLRLEIQENGPIQINNLDHSDEVNYRYMIVIQALANALRTGNYDEGTLAALENSLVTVGKEFKNHSLDEECLDLLVKRYSKIIGKETGDWLEQGWGDVLSGLDLLAGGYITTKFREVPVVKSKVKKGLNSNNPQSYLKRALKNQGLKNTPTRMKETWIEGDYKYTVRVHKGNATYTDADSIYRVARKSTVVGTSGQGSGLEYLGADGKWYSESVLKEFYKDGSKNPLFNETASKMTHIPGGN